MGHRYDEVTFQRETSVILIPDGVSHLIQEGTIGWVTQVLGGNFTVQLTSGRLVRVNAKDAEAIGLDPVPLPEVQRTDDGHIAPETVWEILRSCYDPEIPMNIVELGLIYGLEMRKGESGTCVDVQLTLTAPGCGMGQVLKDDVEGRIGALPGIESVAVELVFDPPWSPERMTEAARLELGMF